MFPLVTDASARTEEHRVSIRICQPQPEQDKVKEAENPGSLRSAITKGNSSLVEQRREGS